MRNLGVVDGIAYACGMAREVYRREGDDNWIAMNAPRKGKEIVGFEAIDGFDRSEIYAVGLKGDIWEWNSSAWTQHASPTNVILNGVCCAPNGEVYICGQQGMLISGRGSSWGLIDLGDFAADFWDVHYFNNTIYLATMFTLFTYTKEDGLEAVNFGDDAPTSCYRLTSAEGVLWSVGSADIFSYDGKSWTRVD
ncbi:MAG: hypothetical protein HKN43_05565 [Rhodothermales bacterium]|nr:hypothetical protein [Rhodothermales bacterium]